jgi:hypothetical protein
VTWSRHSVLGNIVIRRDSHAVLVRSIKGVLGKLDLRLLIRLDFVQTIDLGRNFLLQFFDHLV